MNDASPQSQTKPAGRLSTDISDLYRLIEENRQAGRDLERIDLLPEDWLAEIKRIEANIRDYQWRILQLRTVTA